MAREELVTRPRHVSYARERMTYIGCIHTPVTEPCFFKRKEAEKLIHPLAYRLYAPLPPCPDLGSDEVKHGHTEPLEMTGEAQMKIRTVGQKRGRGRVPFHKANQLAIVPIEPRQVMHDLRQPNNGKLSGIDNGFYTFGSQFGTGAAVEAERWIPSREAPDKASGIRIAGRLACGNQKLHVVFPKCTAQN